MKRWMLIVCACITLSGVSFLTGIRCERARIQREFDGAMGSMIEELHDVMPGVDSRVLRQMKETVDDEAAKARRDRDE